MQVKYKNFLFYRLLFIKFVGIVFVSPYDLFSWFHLASTSASSSFDSITSSQIIVESSIILAKYIPLSQLHVARF